MYFFATIRQMADSLCWADSNCSITLSIFRSLMRICPFRLNLQTTQKPSGSLQFNLTTSHFVSGQLWSVFIAACFLPWLFFFWCHTVQRLPSAVRVALSNCPRPVGSFKEPRHQHELFRSLWEPPKQQLSKACGPPVNKLECTTEHFLFLPGALQLHQKNFKQLTVSPLRPPTPTPFSSVDFTWGRRGVTFLIHAHTYTHSQRTRSPTPQIKDGLGASVAPQRGSLCVVCREATPATPSM